jgi:HK97 family phage prohead protease
MKFYTAADFKDGLRKGEKPSSVQKTYVGLNEPVNERQIKFTISTDEIDRDGDTIMQSGWDLSNYIRNPVVLLNHKSADLPVAKCVGIGVKNGALKATIEFVPQVFPIIGEIAESVYQLCKNGFLNATSVGFRPLEWDWASDDNNGVVFNKQELLEFSIVSVPSNPAALIEPPSWFDSDAQRNTRVLNTKDTLRLRLRVLQLGI